MDDDLDSEPVARVNLTAFGNWTDLTSEDLEEIGLTDLQTVILACLATLIPLTIALITALIARCFWKRYLKRKAIRCQGSLHRIESSDPRRTLQSSCDEMKTSESQFSVIPAEEVAEVISMYSNGTAINPKNASNGSIITLTMRNNHLIVEKEERIPGVTPLPSKSFISQGDTTIYTVDVEDDSFREYAEQYSQCSVSRTTSRDFLIHKDHHSEDRYYEGRSGYSVVPEDNYLPYRKAWGEPEDDGPFVVEESPIELTKAPLPKIEEEYDESAEKKKLEQLQREKQDIQEQIKKYQEILQRENAELLSFASQNAKQDFDDIDSDGEIVVMEDEFDDEEEEENEENERRQETANKILILNNDHLHNITLPEKISPTDLAGRMAGHLDLNTICENGEKTDVEDLDDDWSTGFSDEEDDDQDFQFPRDTRDFYRIENRKYDNLACMQIREEESNATSNIDDVTVSSRTEGDVARSNGLANEVIDSSKTGKEEMAVSGKTTRFSPLKNATNVDDYTDFSDDDDDDEDKSNLENLSVTTEINVGHSSLAEKKADSDEDKVSDEKSKSSSSSRGSYQNDYSYGNQSEYTLDESCPSSSYYKQSAVTEVKLPEPPSPFQNSYKGREKEKNDLFFIEQPHQKGFKSEFSLPGDETFLSRTIISNNLSDSSDLN